MFPSLTSRIAALGALVVVALLGLALLLALAFIKTRESFRWVTHSAEVIDTADAALIELRDAESGQRGFVITHNPEFARTFEETVAKSQKAVDHLVKLTVDNPVQNVRARNLGKVIQRRIDVMRRPLELARRGEFEKARAAITSGYGRELMARVALDSQAFLMEENALQTVRIKDADQRLTRLKDLALFGSPLIALLVILVSVLIIQGIRRPVEIIRKAMTALGSGESDTRITINMRSREFNQLARGYNLMADQLEAAVANLGRSEGELQDVNSELLRNTEALRDRGRGHRTSGRDGPSHAGGAHR
jgi:CHASE3 domain sensor protein